MVTLIRGFSVVRVQKYTPKVDPGLYVNGNTNPGLLVERFPFPKGWKKMAWSFSTFEAAKKKYDKLLEISKNTAENQICAA